MVLRYMYTVLCLNSSGNENNFTSRTITSGNEAPVWGYRGFAENVTTS